MSTPGPYTFAVCDPGKLYDPGELYPMVRALEANAAHCADAWGLPRPAVVLIDDFAPLPLLANVHPVVLVDEGGSSGILAQHGFDWARFVTASRVFCHRSTGLRVGKRSVCEAAGHEITEALVDPYVNRWMVHPQDPRVHVALEVCLAPDTIVPLADGTLPTIETLAGRGGQFHVFAVNAAGRTVVAQAHSARRTMGHADVLKISLTDGSSVRCTPDHRVLMADGTYRRARELASGDKLSNVSPAAPTPDARYGGCGDFVALGEDRPPLRARANLDDFRTGELRAPMKFATPIAIPTHATLRRCVDHVLSVGTSKQMLGVGADPIVASMADFLPIGDYSEVDLIREPVNIMGFAIEPDLSISVRALASGPVPASVLDNDPQPEDGRGGLWRPSLKGGKTGIDAPAAFDPAVVRVAKALCDQRSRTSDDRARLHVKVVDSVKECGKSDVYDLTVPIHRNFAVGAGTFVHNCDPVQDTYDVLIEWRHTTTRWPVANFVLPAWFEPEVEGKPTPKVDHAGTLSRPGDLGPEGYAILRDYKADRVFAVWGSRGIPGPERHAALRHVQARTRRRGVKVEELADP